MDLTARNALDRTIRLLNLDYFNGKLDDEEILDGLTRTTVRLVAKADDLTSYAGQTALITAAVLIAMNGINIELDLPDVPLIGSQPPLQGDGLRGSLLGHGKQTIPGLIITTEVLEPNLVLAFGSAGDTSSHDCFVVTGDDRTAQLGMKGSVPPTPWRGAWPMGALAAGGAAAALAVRVAIAEIARRAGRSRPPLCPPLSSGAVKLSVGPRATSKVDLGTVDCISAGAITQSVLYCLLRLPRVHGTVRAFDDDALDVANLNRYGLMRDSDRGLLKAPFLEQFSSAELTVAGIPDRFTSRDHRITARRVLVGADDIPTRWDVQGQRPEWLAVGATGHLLAMVSNHEPDGPCAGCLHDHDDEFANDVVPTASIISYWAGLMLAATLLDSINAATTPGRVTSAFPLGLGGAHSVWEGPVQPNARCPLGCAASASAAKPLSALARR